MIPSQCECTSVMFICPFSSTKNIILAFRESDRCFLIEDETCFVSTQIVNKILQGLVKGRAKRDDGDLILTDGRIHDDEIKR